MSRWDDKLADPTYIAYHTAIEDGCEKVKKYYCAFNKRPAFALSIGMAII